MNYRKVLEDYWQQYQPGWKIPTGFHVHHIKPISTFEDPNDPRIHNPRNLIALHPDDHVSIHENRGDHYVSGGSLTRIAGRTWTEESKQKVSAAMKKQYANGRVNSKGMLGKKLTTEQKEKISKTHKGVSKSEAHKEKLRQNLKGKKWRVVNGKREWYSV